MLLRSHIGTCYPIVLVIALLQLATGVSYLLLILSLRGPALSGGFVVYLSEVFSRVSGKFSGRRVVIVKGLLITAFLSREVLSLRTARNVIGVLGLF